MVSRPGWGRSAESPGELRSFTWISEVEAGVIPALWVDATVTCLIFIQGLTLCSCLFAPTYIFPFSLQALAICLGILFSPRYLHFATISFSHLGCLQFASVSFSHPDTYTLLRYPFLTLDACNLLWYHTNRLSIILASSYSSGIQSIAICKESTSPWTSSRTKSSRGL